MILKQWPLKKCVMVNIYLKGGQTITVKAKKFTARRGADNDLKSLEWELIENDEQLLYVRLDDVSMITTKKI